MIKPEKKNFMNELTYNNALMKYEKHLNYISTTKNVVKTISGSSHIWDAMIDYCKETETKFSNFVFQAIKEKLERER